MALELAPQLLCYARFRVSSQTELSSKDAYQLQLALIGRHKSKRVGDHSNDKSIRLNGRLRQTADYADSTKESLLEKFHPYRSVSSFRQECFQDLVGT